jgi:hypothetical protein
VTWIIIFLEKSGKFGAIYSMKNPLYSSNFSKTPSVEKSLPKHSPGFLSGIF